MNINKSIITPVLLIIGIFSVVLGLVFWSASYAKNMQEEYTVGKSEKVVKQNFEKKKILKGKQLSQQEWNNKKTEKVNQLKQYFADTRDSELLGASNNEIKSLDVKDKSYNEFMDDMNEWLEIAQGENCFKNLDPEGEGILTWDLVESINNKLENNEC